MGGVSSASLQSEGSIPPVGPPEAEFSNFLRTPGIDSTKSIPCEESIRLWNWLFEALSPWEGIEDFIIVVVICSVWRIDTPIGQHICNTQAIWQLSAGDEKSIPALKIYIFRDMADSILYSIPTQLQKSIPPPPPHPQKKKGGVVGGGVFGGG